ETKRDQAFRLDIEQKGFGGVPSMRLEHCSRRLLDAISLGPERLRGLVSRDVEAANTVPVDVEDRRSIAVDAAAETDGRRRNDGLRRRGQAVEGDSEWKLDHAAPAPARAAILAGQPCARNGNFPAVQSVPIGA